MGALPTKNGRAKFRFLLNQHTLGERESGTARLEEAKLAFQAAYSVYPAADYPEHHAYFEKVLAAIDQLIDGRSP